MEEFLEVESEKMQRKEGQLTKNGRRFVQWRFIIDTDTDLTEKMIESIREEVNTSFLHTTYIFIDP